MQFCLELVKGSALRWFLWAVWYQPERAVGHSLTHQAWCRPTGEMAFLKWRMHLNNHLIAAWGILSRNWWAQKTRCSLPWQLPFQLMDLSVPASSSRGEVEPHKFQHQASAGWHWWHSMWGLLCHHGHGAGLGDAHTPSRPPLKAAVVLRSCVALLCEG